MKLQAASSDPAKWLRRPSQHRTPEIRLLCFHHAGGAASAYRRWPRLLPDSIEPVAVQLPGRAERFAEPAFQRRAPLVEALADVLEPLLDRPFACYGLSMGARVAWALTHHLRERALPMPVALYLASAAAPDAEDRQAHRRRDLVEYLREMGGTPPEVLAEPQLLELVLRTVRADLALSDALRFRPSEPLALPIVAFAGEDDPEGSPERMSGWRRETTGRFRLDVRAGGHFPDEQAQLRAIRIVAGDLLGEAYGEPVLSPESGNPAGQWSP